MKCSDLLEHLSDEAHLIAPHQTLLCYVAWNGNCTTIELKL